MKIVLNRAIALAVAKKVLVLTQEFMVDLKADIEALEDSNDRQIQSGSKLVKQEYKAGSVVFTIDTSKLGEKISDLWHLGAIKFLK